MLSFLIFYDSGDFFQFRPVGGVPLYDRPAASGHESEAVRQGRMLWERITCVVFLQQQMRQDDKEWLDMLEKLRYGACEESEYQLVLQQVIDNKEAIPAEWMNNLTIVVPRNPLRTALNDHQAIEFARAQMQPVLVVAAEDVRSHGRGKCSTLKLSIRMKLRESPDTQTQGLAGKLPIVSGMPVMLRKNIALHLGLCNGAKGYIYKIILDENEPPIPEWDNRSLDPPVHKLRYMPKCLLIKFPGCKLQKSLCPQWSDDPEVVPIRPVTTTFYLPGASKKQKSTLPKELKKVPRVRRTQFPLIPAFAKTGHATQGDTLSKVLAELNGCELFANAVYVLLSRVKKRQDMLLMRWFPIDLLQKPPPETLLEEQQRLEELDWETVRAFDKRIQGLVQEALETRKKRKEFRDKAMRNMTKIKILQEEKKQLHKEEKKAAKKKGITPPFHRDSTANRSNGKEEKKMPLQSPKKRKANDKDENPRQPKQSIAMSEYNKTLLDPRQPLSDTHIYNAMNIIKDQFRDINGLQDTLLAALPSYGYSYTNSDKKPTAQIHHTGQFHWILSCSLPGVEIGSFDSLANPQNWPTSAVRDQLFQMHYQRGSQADSLLVQLYPCQKQTGGSQCGDFSIANLVEFVSNNCSINAVTAATFDQSRMRDHLRICLEQKQFTKFPRASNIAPKTHNVVVPILLQVCSLIFCQHFFYTLFLYREISFPGCFSLLLQYLLLATMPHHQLRTLAVLLHNRTNLLNLMVNAKTHDMAVNHFCLVFNAMLTTDVSVQMIFLKSLSLMYV